MLLELIGVPATSPTPDLSLTIAVQLDPDAASSGGGRAGGSHHSQDPLHRKAVEEPAVAMAIDYMKEMGWNEVVTLGKPFDLVCRKTGRDDEKHVEVKGLTGAGSSVEYTSNEVRHFRQCPHGGDLIVVDDINIEKGTYASSGGRLRHFENYDAPKEDLQPTRYLGRVPEARTVN
jgi:hypothetical protein